MEAAYPDARGTAPAAAAFSEDTTPGDSPRSGDSAESTSFRCAICLVRACPELRSDPAVPRALMLTCVQWHVGHTVTCTAASCAVRRCAAGLTTGTQHCRRRCGCRWG
jgi:hypothetical protein